MKLKQVIYLYVCWCMAIRLNTEHTSINKKKQNASTAEEQVFGASFTYAQIELCALFNFKRKGNNA